VRLRTTFVVATVMFLILTSSVVAAHRLYIKHRIGEVEVKAFFGGGTPCRDAVVKIYDDAGKLIFEGVTDEEGKFRFSPVVGVVSYRVVVESTHIPGHRAETVINLAAPGSAETGESFAAIPLYARVVAGLGWLLGLAGAAMVYTGWRARRHEKGKSCGST